MKKSLIVAMARNGVIGHQNSLPWGKLPGDLPRFKNLTMGKPCIMGRKTFESLPKALDGRLNIVVSRNGFTANGGNVRAVASIAQAWSVAHDSGTDETFVIGGAEIYKQTIASCDRMYLTVIEQDFDGDTRIDLSDLFDWTVVSTARIDGPLPYRNFLLERRKPTQTLTLERLPDNNLPLPQYGTALSAGIDFAACLTRVCKLVDPGTGNKHDFWASHNSARLPKPPLSQPSPNELTLYIHHGETVLVPLGFKCSFDSTHVLKIYPRSSVGLKGLVLANGTGIVDPDYRGELFAALVNRTSTSIAIKHGERVVQGILTPFSQGAVMEGKVDETVRGEGGFGSTGKMAS